MGSRCGRGISLDWGGSGCPLSSEAGQEPHHRGQNLFKCRKSPRITRSDANKWEEEVGVRIRIGLGKERLGIKITIKKGRSAPSPPGGEGDAKHAEGMAEGVRVR